MLDIRAACCVLYAGYIVSVEKYYQPYENVEKIPQKWLNIKHKLTQNMT